MRAAIYCRLSDEDRNKKNASDESESIQNQKSLLLEYCASQEWRVVDIYCDEDMSGADRARPEFNRMISDCRDGKIDVVICKTQSRFSRDMEVIEHYIHNKFRRWGIRFIGLLDHADTEDYANKKSRQINGLINEWYLEDLSENIKRTLRHKKENGVYTGAFAPYGYRLDEEKRGKLFLDSAAALIVRRIYDDYLSGMGYITIAKKLNAEKIPSPAVYKRLCGSKFYTHTTKAHEPIWTDCTVRQILTNPVYMGTLVQGKTEKVSYKQKQRKVIEKENRIILPHAHAPIISEAIWEEVNEKIGKGYRSQKTNGERHIFAGRVFCKACGGSMWKMSYRLKNGRYEYLKCKTTKCSENICKNRESIRLDILKDLVEREVRTLLSSLYQPEGIDHDKLFHQELFEVEDTEKAIQNKILKQKSNIKQLYKDKLDDIIDNEEFYMLLQDIRKDISCLEAQLCALSKRPAIGERQERFVREFPKEMVLDSFSVSCLIQKIEIGIPEHGKRSIFIYWNL